MPRLFEETARLSSSRCPDIPGWREECGDQDVPLTLVWLAPWTGGLEPLIPSLGGLPGLAGSRRGRVAVTG